VNTKKVRVRVVRNSKERVADGNRSYFGAQREEIVLSVLCQRSVKRSFPTSLEYKRRRIQRKRRGKKIR